MTTGPPPRQPERAPDPELPELKQDVRPEHVSEKIEQLQRDFKQKSESK
ncbi:MAG: hypothetical protein ACREJB_09770 [Planctomycetaceae bacterium]